MSDTPAGWAELIAAPLGAKPLVDCAFGLLPFLVDPPLCLEPALPAPRTAPP